MHGHGDGLGSPEGERGDGKRGADLRRCPRPQGRRAEGITLLALPFDLLTSSLTRGHCAFKGSGEGGNSLDPQLQPDGGALGCSRCLFSWSHPLHLHSCHYYSGVPPVPLHGVQT